jgi:hypothetical protein
MISKNYLLILSLLLSACGGGGGGGSNKSSAASVLVSISTTTGGSVSPSASSIPLGTSASFTVVAGEGYSLGTIQGCNGSLQGNSYVTGNLSASCTVNVVFVRNAYQVSAVANDGGSIAVNQATILHGDTWSLLLQPDTGYQVESVSGCGVGNLNGNDYTSAPVTGSCQLSVQFAKKKVTISGLVATGAALANARVEAKCQGGSGFSSTVTTNAQGEFSGQVVALDLPCALHAHTENPAISLQGVAVQAGRVNITPFTDMTLTLASGLPSPAWYEQGSVTDILPLLADAQARLLALFKSNGYALPQGEFKPFDGELVIGDAWDMVLDQLATGIRQTAALDYMSLMHELIAGQTHKFPLPKGDQEQTAEACFNPLLYQLRTQVHTKRHVFSLATSGLENHNLFEHRLENTRSMPEGAGNLLVQEHQIKSCFSTASDLSNKTCWGTFGYQLKSVNPSVKTVAELAAGYEQNPEHNTPDQTLRNVVFEETYSP